MAETTTVKSGVSTSEFWLTILTNVVVVLQTLDGQIEGKWVAVVLAAVNGVYGVMRALVKSNATNSSTTTTS